MYISLFIVNTADDKGLPSGMVEYFVDEDGKYYYQSTVDGQALVMNTPAVNQDEVWTKFFLYSKWRTKFLCLLYCY